MKYSEDETSNAASAEKGEERAKGFVGFWFGGFGGGGGIESQAT